MEARQPVMSVFWSHSLNVRRFPPDLAAVPSLPKETAYLHTHFNKISKISKQNSIDLGNIELIIFNSLQNHCLLPVQLTAFRVHFSQLYNELTAVSKLTESLRIFHLHNNNISTITDEMFCKGDTSHYIRSNLDRVRLNGDPIKLSGYPNSFICLQSLSVGWYN
uniref:Osteoglycin, paralog b n=1 Tax=Xiphophorus maculatus TaxID=8083 RepID=A0A3B5Q5Q8_XIPMA